MYQYSCIYSLPLRPSEINVKSGKSYTFRLIVRGVGKSIGKKFGNGVYIGTLNEIKHTLTNQWTSLESGEIDHNNTHYKLFVRFSGNACIQ